MKYPPQAAGRVLPYYNFPVLHYMVSTGRLLGMARKLIPAA